MQPLLQKRQGKVAKRHARRQAPKPTLPIDFHARQNARREYAEEENTCFHNFAVIELPRGRLHARPR